jgi:hypothetical protein
MAMRRQAHGVCAIAALKPEETLRHKAAPAS